MKELLQLAAEMGIEVVEATLVGKEGGYNRTRSRIRLQRKLSERVKRCALAHELGHAVFGHEPTQFGPIHNRQERQANEWAARRLITIEDFREAEIRRDGHVPSMAFDLNVTPELVETYQSMIERAISQVA